MRTSKIIHVVACHAEGEVGDVVVGGVAPPPGETLWEQSRFIAEDGSLRNFLLNEPRGGVFRHVNLLVPAKDPRAQMGFIIMEPEDTPPMSGSNAICVATVLLDAGILPMQEPETHLTLEAPGGLIAVTADCRNGKAKRVSIENVPSFADRLDAPLELAGLGALKVDIAYGGDSFVIVEAAALGFLIAPDEARDLAETGLRIIAAANEQLGFSHPEARGLGPHLLLSVRRASRAPGKRTSRSERGRGPPRQDRPLSDRDRLQRPYGDVERARVDDGKRRLPRSLHHRFGVSLPDRPPGHGWRPASHRSDRFRPGLDYRRQPVYAGPRRSVAIRLPARRHLAARQEFNLSVLCGSRVSLDAKMAMKYPVHDLLSSPQADFNNFALRLA